MPLLLSHSIRVLKGLGPKTAEAFAKQGISTIEDLFYFFPRAWIDATRILPVSQLRMGMSGLIDVQVVTVREGTSQRTRLPYMRCLVADTSGSIEVMWFHPKFLKGKVYPGARLMLYGRLHGWNAQSAMMVSPKFITKPAILPVYTEISGVPTAQIRKLFTQLSDTVNQVQDYLPEDVRRRYELPSLSDVIKGMHEPQSLQDINVAKMRLGFDELLMIMFPTLVAQQERAKERVGVLSRHDSEVAAWIKTLPFPLTNDQQTVIEEILQDISTDKPMNRLVQGDVGSGKTVVGLAAVLQTVLAGKQVVWLAPTELLAQQHFATAKGYLLQSETAAPYDLSVGLWTRTNHILANCQSEQKAAASEVEKCPFIIGTHALLSDKIKLRDLGLLIIDEQHRFGVKQRAQLRQYGGNPVHLLSMTATPIPRTMALVVYGDLSLSVIKEKPKGRKPVTTRVVLEENRPKAYQFIARHIADGGQAYVICPTIEPAADDEANVFTQLFQDVEEKKAVTVWFDQIRSLFPEARVGLLHGKLPAKDKEAIMTEFRNGDVDILVCTTVVEVGVDVPNANIMMIENAEYFGLAQLHQLRGRVGRGERQSFCFLFPTSDKKADNARLRIMEETDDGFILAEKDLELRGPGELTGLAQSGLPNLRFASLQDAKRIEQIREVAQELLSNPIFHESLERFWRTYHPE